MSAVKERQPRGISWRSRGLTGIGLIVERELSGQLSLLGRCATAVPRGRVKAAQERQSRQRAGRRSIARQSSQNQRDWVVGRIASLLLHELAAVSDFTTCQSCWWSGREEGSKEGSFPRRGAAHSEAARCKTTSSCIAHSHPPPHSLLHDIAVSVPRTRPSPEINARSRRTREPHAHHAYTYAPLRARPLRHSPRRLPQPRAGLCAVDVRGAAAALCLVPCALFNLPAQTPDSRTLRPIAAAVTASSTATFPPRPFHAHLTPTPRPATSFLNIAPTSATLCIAFTHTPLSRAIPRHACARPRVPRSPRAPEAPSPNSASPLPPQQKSP